MPSLDPSFRILVLLGSLGLGSIAGTLSACQGDPADPIEASGGGGGGGGATATGGQVSFDEFFTPPAQPTEPGIEGLESVVITLDPDGELVDLALGETVEIAVTATGTFDDDSTRDLTAEVTWTSGISGVPVEDGRLSTSRPGSYLIEARSGSVVGRATVTVRLVGAVVADDLPADAATLLDGAAAGTPVRIAYPIDGALFPSNFGPPEFHVEGAGTRSIGRVHFQGEAIDLEVAVPCTPLTGGCEIVLGADLIPLLAGASEAETLTATVRVMNADGSDLGESDPIEVRWASTGVSGAIYFWRAGGRVPGGAPAPTGIARLDLDHLSTPVAPFWSQPGDTAQSPLPAAPWAGAALSDQTAPCVGCHSISRDGRTLAVSLGGSDTASFALIDVASRSIVDQRLVDGLNGVGFAQFTAFSPSGDRMVNSLDGQLILRSASAGLADLRPLGFPGVATPISHPFWADRAFAFVSYPALGLRGNSDLVEGGEIYLAHATPSEIDTANAPLRLVPAASGFTHFFPSVSSDGAWVSFVSASCTGPATPAAPYGPGACDGYDDIGSTLRLVSVTDRTRTNLDRANSGSNLSNSWPRWSPVVGQRFRGKQLHFIAFSSRRSYGLKIANPDPTDPATHPQIWFAALALPVDGSGPDEDPSFAPVWLPNQNDSLAEPSGNHVPQWTAEFVLPQ